ncbi:MAG: hypothetical protein LBR81_03770 [Prevotellaceae bacterium]|jgi:hypothetical protein|nr:hypothetical protein [Prevotellaceae bacterium]
MKTISRFYCLAFFLLVTTAVNAQIDTATIQKRAAQVSSKGKSVEQLAESLSADNFNETSKVIAISYWVATNISYDYKGYLEGRPEVWTPEEVLRKRKALCGEYAELFKQLCTFAGMQAEVVGGYVKEEDFIEGDTLFRSNHAWNAVKVDGVWQLFDLTWAAGKIQPAKQTFKKNTAGLFGIPYRQKLVYRKQFNPEWIFAQPQKMIFTHLPEMPAFQMLEETLTYSEFVEGDSVIADFLGEEPAIAVPNTELDEFIAKTPVEKLTINAEDGIEDNPFNNAMRGYRYLQALGFMYENLYESKTRSINADRATLLQMRRYAQLSDSLLKQSMRDNDFEFVRMQKRSQSWKELLKSSNRQHIATLKARVKHNGANTKTINRVDKKGKSMEEYFDARHKQYMRTPALDSRRPRTPDSTAARLSRMQLHQQDSIWKLVCLKYLVNLYSVNDPYKYDAVMSKVQTEPQALDIYEKSLAKVKIDDAQYAEGVPMAHTSRDFIRKEWLTQKLYLADSIKHENVDSLTGNMYNDQMKFFDYTKQYTRSTKDRLTLIKMAKRNSGIDQQEDSIFVEAIRRYISDLDNFQLYLKPYMAGHNELKKQFDLQNDCMNAIMKRLKKESDVENFRHNHYVAYRQKIRQAENNRAKLAIKQIIAYLPAIERSLLTKKQ